MIRLFACALVALLGIGHAHAQALDPQELCRQHASAFLDALDKNDYAGAGVDFDASMQTALPPKKLEQEWTSLVSKYGKLNARGQPHTAVDQGYIAVMVPLIFEHATLAAQIACDTTGAVAGFHMVPLPEKAQF
ncbi:MAG: DUF3887 domain-containing protein [Rhodanobacteraceae bacterium]